MRIAAAVLILCAVTATFAMAGCAEKKTRSMTIEGPEKKTEIKIESTEKK